VRFSWHENAQIDIALIREYAAQFSDDAADGLIRRITARGRQVAVFPRSGRVVPEFGQDDLREIIEGEYRIIYRVRGESVMVLSVLHGSRNLLEIPE
jgi:toxin ParE1/3/4